MGRYFRYRQLCTDRSAAAILNELLAWLDVPSLCPASKPLACLTVPSLLQVPREGVTVKHIHSGEPLLVDRYALAQIIIMTIADFSEQLFSWQVRGGREKVRDR